MKADETLLTGANAPLDTIDEAPITRTEEAPLVGTLRFVFVMGVTFFALWLGMYALLRGRW